MNREELEGTFVAQDDNGKKHTIYKYVELIDMTGVDGKEVMLKGRRHLRTADRSTVNYIEKGKYLLVKHNLSLYSDSPDAL